MASTESGVPANLTSVSKTTTTSYFNAGPKRIHWSREGDLTTTHVLEVYPGMTTEDLHSAICSVLLVHPGDATRVVVVKKDGVIVPLSVAMPANSGLDGDRYVVSVLGVASGFVADQSRSVIKDVAEVVDEIEALKWQVRLLKKQMRARPGSFDASPASAMVSKGKNVILSDEEASDMIHDIEMLVAELGILRDLKLDIQVFRRFMFGVKDAFDKSPGSVDFSQSCLTTRAVFHAFSANTFMSLMMKWRSVDQLVYLLCVLTSGVRKPVEEGKKAESSKSQDQFGIIMSLFNNPSTNFVSHFDQLDFKEFKQSLKTSITMFSTPRTFIGTIPALKKPGGADSPKTESVIPAFSARERFNATASSKAEVKRRASMDLGSSKSSFKAAEVQQKKEVVQTIPQAVTSTAPVTPPREDKVLKERSLAKAYEEAGIDRELATLIRQDMLELNPNVRWTDIAGQEEAKTLLAEALVMPALMPEFFKGIRRPWRGILMCGPPGTGKTMLAKAVATECNTTFFNISASSISSKWRGESEKLVRTLFQMARLHSPSTIFIDEIESISSTRGGASEHETSRRVKTELLVQMDGVGSSLIKSLDGRDPVVMVLAATNLPWLLDEAMRRRLEKRIYIGPPDLLAREQMLRISLKDVDVEEDVDVEDIAKRVQGFSGADIATLCRDAAMMKLREKMRSVKPSELNLLKPEDLKLPVSKSDFEAALLKVQSSLSSADFERYDQWLADYGSA